MDGVHNKLNDVYTQWYDNTHMIIEERKEKKRRAVVSGLGMSHK